jgi:LemA protein
MMPYVLSTVIFMPFLYTILIYNGLVSLQNHMRDAWSNIDTELKRRYDLIPNLVATVKGYARHEQTILARVVQLRNQCKANRGSTTSQATDERELVRAMQQLLAVVERYPDLKADRHFLDLQRELINTEDRIQAARRFFNGNVRDYRNKCECFPSSIVASIFNFPPADFFEVDSSVRRVPSCKIS